MKKKPLHDPSRFHSRPFETTCWSVVVRAGDLNSRESKQAIQYLCEQYWFPLYLFARKKVDNDHDAQDLTQAFFSHLIDRNFFAAADQSKGRFRTFLLTSIQNFIRNHWKKERAAKRGGDAQHFAIDFASGPGDSVSAQYLQSPARTAEQIFERRWAIDMLKHAIELLEFDYQSDGQAELFKQLKPTIAASQSAPPYAEIAAQLGISVANVKVAAFRLRENFRRKVRQLVADTVNDPADVEDEIKSLFNIFAQ